MWPLLCSPLITTIQALCSPWVTHFRQSGGKCCLSSFYSVLKILARHQCGKAAWDNSSAAMIPGTNSLSGDKLWRYEKYCRDYTSVAAPKEVRLDHAGCRAPLHKEIPVWVNPGLKLPSFPGGIGSLICHELDKTLRRHDRLQQVLKSQR